MDFASLMSKEIAKAKGGTLSTNTTATKTSSSDTSDTTKAAAAPPKFISRREAEEQRRAAYLAEQKAIEEVRTAKVAAKRKREEEAAEEARAREEKRQKLADESRARREAKAAEEERARRKRLGLPEVPPQGADDKNTKTDQDDDLDGDDSDDVEIPDDDEGLRRKLRELGEPSVLFGETLPARKRRYRTIVRGEAAANVPIPTTLRPVDEKDMKVPDKLPPTSDKKAQRYLFRQLSSYFNMVLREWEAALARENNAGTTVGQQAIHAMVSSKETMKPLFRMFEKGDIDDTILKAIVEIVKAAQERRYVDANDGYLRLSIGKAAWPIGVTMVGIHERSAREKLHNGERGHIMGSETTRKFLQSIKRCLTFAQVRWPPDDIRQLMG